MGGLKLPNRAKPPKMKVRCISIAARVEVYSPVGQGMVLAISKREHCPIAVGATSRARHFLDTSYIQ